MNKTQTAEQTFSKMASANAPKPETAALPDKPVFMLKRIGSTTYKVSVYFSGTSKESINDKITRLIRNEIQNRKAAG